MAEAEVLDVTDRLNGLTHKTTLSPTPRRSWKPLLNLLRAKLRKPLKPLRPQKKEQENLFLKLPKCPNCWYVNKPLSPPWKNTRRLWKLRSPSLPLKLMKPNHTHSREDVKQWLVFRTELRKLKMNLMLNREDTVRL